MSTSVGPLDFFIVEANEYIERIDALIAGSGPGGPEAAQLLRHARSLRGSATMARQYGISQLGAAVERCARALREGAVKWNLALSGALVAAIDDLKILLRGVRNPTAADERRVQSRVAELERLLPNRYQPELTPATASGGLSFVVFETNALAQALEQIRQRPTDRSALSEALQRVRTLRGVAALRDLVPLPEILDAVDRAGKAVELSGNAPGGNHLELFQSAAALLRRSANDLGAGRRPVPNTPEHQHFGAALGALGMDSGEADRIVPVSELFYDDAGPHLVTAAALPPTTPTERFRMEVVSLAEHLRRILGEARVATDPVTIDRLTRELRGALRALESAAKSFGERQVAQFVAGWSDRIYALDASALTALEGAAALLANPHAAPGDLGVRLEALAPSRPSLALRLEPPSGPRPAPARRPTPPPSTATPPRPSSRTPTGKELYDILQTGINGFGQLDTEPLSKPVAVDDVVPIEVLLYRGRSAMARAIQLKNELRAANGTPSSEALAELYDLLDLAVAE
jgi:hypothetical protein